MVWTRKLWEIAGALAALGGAAGAGCSGANHLVGIDGSAGGSISGGAGTSGGSRATPGSGGGGAVASSPGTAGTSTVVGSAGTESHGDGVTPVNNGTGGTLGGTRTTFIDQIVQSVDQDQSQPSKCLPRDLPEDSTGSAVCQMAVARLTSTCDCTGAGLAPASATFAEAVRQNLIASGTCGDATGQHPCTDFCVCNVLQATGSDLTPCKTEATPSAATTGWCYVSAADGAPEAALVANCPANQARKLRFLGNAIAPSDGIDFIACSALTPEPALPTHPGAALGQTCIGTDEYNPDFSGYDPKELTVDDRAASCASGVCLMNHFQGRSSCLYGQNLGASGCLVPGSNEPVSVEVFPQLRARQASLAATCGCRCDGDGPGPYCTCPESMQCEHLVDSLNLPSDDAYAGSYCVPKGSEYDRTQLGANCVSSGSGVGTCGTQNP